MIMDRERTVMITKVKESHTPYNKPSTIRSKEGILAAATSRNKAACKREA